MKKVAIYGAGVTGHRVYNAIKNECEVVCFIDGNPKKVRGGGF